MKQLLPILALLALPALAMAQTDCEHAENIVPGTHAASFQNGSEVPTPVCTNGTNNNPLKGAWFTYTPTELHTTTVRTNLDGYPLVDTRVHIYTGTCGNLVCVGGDDDSGPNYTSVATFMAEAGVTYYIAFDDNWSDSAFHFELSESVFVPQMFTAVSTPVAGSYKYCVVDMNGDYLDDIVSVGDNAVNVLYQASNDSGFTAAVLPAVSTTFMPYWSMAAGDYDKNGYNDLLYGDGSGAVVLLANADGTGFTTKLETTQYVFSQRTNFVDIDNDGNLDAFVCHDVDPNVYFLNDGAGGFSFHQGGVGDHPDGGNYGSIWIDYDNDGDVDLFIAKCRGGGSTARINELHRNDGNGVFTPVASLNVNTSNLAQATQTWSSAWGDYDNDGDLDVLVGASSFADGGHKMMLNNGDGTFTDVTEGTGFENFTETNVEHVAHDFNNDGFVDVMGGGNKIMLNNGDMTFMPISVTAGPGPVGDLNNDGFLDIQNGNVVHFNNGNENNWLKIHLEGIESNRNGIGARVEIHGTWGIQIRDVKSGDGFKFMSSLNTHFGIGTADEIEQLVIRWPSGVIDIVDNPAINQSLLVVEGSTVLKNPEIANSGFSLYPNPVKDVINFNGNNLNINKVNIYSLDGKLLKTGKAAANTFNVQGFAIGTYIIIAEDVTGKQHSAKIIIE